MFKDLVYNNVIYENYEIDTNGNIRNKKNGNILKKSINASGYYFVTLSLGKRGKVKGIRVHKAVAETFIPNPNNYPIVNHIDRDRLNCNINNLEWVTHKMNTVHSLRQRYSINSFDNNRKLTLKDVEDIRKRNNISNRKLAKLYNVSKTTICNIKNQIYYFSI